MGKKAKRGQIPQSYDPKGLNSLVRYMEMRRVPVEKEAIPSLSIDVSVLEKKVKAFPKKEREAVEKFWGLIPGTLDYSKRRMIIGKAAYEHMLNAAKEPVIKLLSLENLMELDTNINTLVSNILGKIDRGDLELSDYEALKLWKIFLLIFNNGPKMLFEADPDYVHAIYDPRATFDDYGIFRESWKAIEDFVPEKGIKLELILAVLEMCDYKDILSILKMEDLPLPEDEVKKKAEDQVETIDLETCLQVRAFKEKLFKYGEWEVTTNLILGDPQKNTDLRAFFDELDSIRRDWNIQKYRSGTRKIRTSQEVRELTVYTIGGLNFTDSYEVMFLYVTNKLLIKYGFIKED